MHIIPVIDLRHGQVVRAVRGERQRYLPIVSALCGSADPVMVACRLGEHCASATLYVADLDALQGGPVQIGAIAALLRQSSLQIWLDAAFADLATMRATLAALGAEAQRVTPVIASESWRSVDELRQAVRREPQPVLSLDRRRGVALDRGGLGSAPQHWPRRVLSMNLDRVGANEGPDLDALTAIRALAPEAALIGAGGIRGVHDLRAARQAGASAWLVASALHDGALDAGALRAFGAFGSSGSARGEPEAAQAASLRGAAAPPAASA